MTENKKTSKIIGGKIGLPMLLENYGQSPSFLSKKSLLLFTARSGIRLVLEHSQRNVIWLPSYLCPTILSAADSAQTKVLFYPVDENLEVSNTAFLDKVMPQDLFLFINYFGFPFDRQLVRKVKSTGALLIEDCSQALFFDGQNCISDFLLYSPRKFIGVPDGGVLHINHTGLFDFPSLVNPPQEILANMFLAVLLRREFDLYGGDRGWNKYFTAGEALFSSIPYAMSGVTKMLLETVFDYGQIQAQRKRNYCVLLSKLQDIAIYKELPADVTPLGFPVKVNQRNDLQTFLFKHDIYPPIHWDITEAVPKAFTGSHKLSGEILTLPCDQRYDENDMAYMAALVLEFLA